MPNELQDYISQVRKKGFSDKDINDQPNILYNLGVSIGFIVKIAVILVYFYTLNIALREYSSFRTFLNDSLFFVPIQLAFFVSLYSLYHNHFKRPKKPMTTEQEWNLFKGEIVLILILAAMMLPTFLFFITATWQG